jgi:hypothetical protein
MNLIRTLGITTAAKQTLGHIEEKLSLELDIAFEQ